MIYALHLYYVNLYGKCRFKNMWFMHFINKCKQNLWQKWQPTCKCNQDNFQHIHCATFDSNSDSRFKPKFVEKQPWHDLSKLRKARITLNLKLPKSGHSYVSEDKHSANATEPWKTSSHPKKHENTGFLRIQIVLFWQCGLGSCVERQHREICSCNSHLSWRSKRHWARPGCLSRHHSCPTPTRSYLTRRLPGNQTCG